MEAHLYGLAGFWSLDMRERAVREKLGCGLVAISMFLHIKASQASKETRKGKKEQAAGFVESGATLFSFFPLFFSSLLIEGSKNSFLKI